MQACLGTIDFFQTYLLGRHGATVRNASVVLNCVTQYNSYNSFTDTDSVVV